MPGQRILRQQLEDLRRAGVTHISAELAERFTSGAASLSAQATPPPASPSTDAKPASSEDRAATPRHAGTARTESKDSSRSAPQPATLTGLMEKPCSNLSLDERVSALEQLAQRVTACRKCQELADARTQTVFGVGNPEAEIMFIGEAPGADEDRQGEPFVGRAGQLLNKIIEACGLTREEIYICNILRCRPPGNRNPSPVEADNCREFLDGQIATIQPKYIVCWGSCAAQNLLDTKTSIGKMRGRFYNYQGIKVACTYHPSYLLRNPAAKKQVWEDMKFFRADMGVVLK